MRPTVAAIPLCLALALTGCSGDGASEAEDGRHPEARSKIIQPGRPGQPNQTLDPDTTLEESEYNDADAMFLQMMIPHHAQALEMCELAQTRADDERVLALSRRIKGAQGPEIVSMSSWLQARDLPVPTSPEDIEGGHGAHGAHGAHGGHGASMPGMLTDTEMDALRRARGHRFDRLFLAGMIQHHRGAVDMAGTALTDGVDLLANEIANDIAVGQSAEIGRMQDLRSDL
ncbi:MAG: DUF305 domain-containing protein [Nocardioidaceae bacterium]